jgi:hypothetical protein
MGKIHEDRLVVRARNTEIVRRVVMGKVHVARVRSMAIVRLVVLARSMGIVRRAVRVVTIGVSRRKKTFQLAR